ncbi:MAG: hypothetical protein ABIJ61_12220 [bacterium]
MRRSTLSVLLALLVVAIVALPAVASVTRISPTAVENSQSAQAPSSRAACAMTKANGTFASYFGGFEPGMLNVTYFNPVTECGAPAYPFEITDFSFMLYDFWSVGSANLDIVIFDMAVAGDSCAGPGQELCRYPMVADATFMNPNVGTYTFPAGCCVNGPFFIGIEYTAGDPGSIPSVQYDDQATDTCDNWFFYAGAWYEWYDIWSAPVPGYPHFWVGGESESANCGSCGWNPGDPYKMHEPQLPDEAGWDVNATQPLVLADDFLCTETGFIRDFHFWGSWRNGIEGQILYFVLSIHADIPAEQNPDGYSKPGATLWEMEVTDFGFTPIDPPSMEGWYDPSTDTYFPNDHQAYFQYDICIDEQVAFYQQEGTTYWLNVSAVIADPAGTQWGWKSTLDHWNDDAVWAQWGDLNWQEMYEPGDAVFSMFWMGLDPAGQLVPPLSGGVTPFNDGTGINGWYFYPEVEPPFYNIWFYDHPFDPERIKTAHIEFDLFPLEAGPSYLVFVVNYTTDEFPSGNPEPPLPGSPPFWTGRDTLMIFQGEEGHFIFDWTMPDYNPEWVSIDVFGFNYMIPEGSGFIEHRCRPSLDLSFVITTVEVPPPTGACCYDPTGGGVDAACIVTTQADCENNLMGTYMGDGTACAGTEACCLPGGACLDADALCCAQMGGAPQGPGTACSATEACCLPDGTCADLDPLCCLNLQGVPQGPGTVCTAAEACCLPNGSCAMLDPLCCDEMSGVPQGAGTTCSGTSEACCFPDGSCIDADPLCCASLGGTAQGAGTVCLGDNNGNQIDDACEPDEGACCFDDGSCLVLTAADCASQTGTYKGDGTTCLGDNNGNGTDDACESWHPGDGHKMHHPQLPNPQGWDVMATQGIVLADDWMCSETGPVKDIHFWGSWKDGVVGEILYFVLSIHADIPADQSPTGYSMPGPPLWEQPVNQFNITRIEPGLFEGWYNPQTDEKLQNNHSEYFQYDVYLPEQLWFYQEQGTIYWLNIYAVLADPQNTSWGWKSTLDNWNDDAVWADDATYDWIELYEPPYGNYIMNHFAATLDPAGTVVQGFGENAYGDGWYYYPEEGWWNIWFYDHPFSYDRFKDLYLEFDAYTTGQPAYIEVAFNWATDLWSLEQPPEDSMPPLPGVPEAPFIGRQTVLATQDPGGHYLYNFSVEEYNPEWVSVDIRGENVDLPFGLIVHNCLPRQNQSLDLAFVITGGEVCDCVPSDANNDGIRNITDAVYLISYIFGGGPAPTPYPICSGDANCDCIANITDAVYLIQWIFNYGAAPCDCQTWLSSCGPPLR